MLLANDYNLFYVKMRLIILFYICVTLLLPLPGVKILEINCHVPSLIWNMVPFWGLTLPLIPVSDFNHHYVRSGMFGPNRYLFMSMFRATTRSIFKHRVIFIIFLYIPIINGHYEIHLKYN